MGKGGIVTDKLIAAALVFIAIALCILSYRQAQLVPRSEFETVKKHLEWLDRETGNHIMNHPGGEQ
jgi:hypothetical protein